MPRNKISKRANTRQASNNQPSLQKIEKDFLTTPVKLAKQLNKEISSLKQKESKLKKEINKNSSQAKTTENRIKSSAKIQTTAGKKQVNTAKKLLKAIMKDHAGLNKQHGHISKALRQLTDTQAKFLALGKYLKQFDKEWEKNLKADSKVKAPRKKIKGQSQSKTVSMQEQGESQEHAELSIGNINVTEATEESVS